MAGQPGLRGERPKAGPKSLTGSVTAPCRFFLDPALPSLLAPRQCLSLPSSFSLSHVTRAISVFLYSCGHRRGLFSKSGRGP